MNKIAVIIVTYNGEKFIRKCLESVLNSSVLVDVYAIDNASTDNTASILHEFTNILSEVLNENLGFGKANNIAINKVMKMGYEHFFLLNQDTWIKNDTIEKLVRQQTKAPNFGILSPLHFDSSAEKLDLNFANYFNKKSQISAHLFEVPFVNAAAWLVSTPCFTKIGLFEAAFNHYGEDRNFCDRALFHGFKIGIVDESQMVHDRTIVRKFAKDVQQSKYAILNTLININISIRRSYFTAMRQVIGLPKFFVPSYGIINSVLMFSELAIFFVNNILHFKKIEAIRDQSIKGKNGI